MNYVQIQQFLVLSKTMNMTRAAKELYITQPALSHSLSKLEEELGLKLVYRDGKHLIMTEAGEKIRKDFEEIEAAYKKMFSHARDISERQKKKLVLGFSGSITAFSSIFNFGILSSFQGISIEKIFAEYEMIDHMLQNGQVDFAITFPPLVGKNIESHVLIHDPIGVAVAEGHPLLRKKKIYLADLQPYSLVGLTKDNPFPTYCNQLLENRKVRMMQKSLGYNELMREVEKGRNQGKLLGLTSKKQFGSWFGTGYHYLPIEDFDEALVTSVSWKTDSSFLHEYKGLIDYLEQWYDRIYYRNYTFLNLE